MGKRFVSVAVVVMVSLGGLVLGGCDEDDSKSKSDKSGTEQDKSVAEKVSEVVAQFGGTVLAAGSHHVEVLPSVDGRIEASVRTPEGKALTKDAAQVAARVRVRPKGASDEQSPSSAEAGEASEASGEADSESTNGDDGAGNAEADDEGEDHDAEEQDEGAGATTEKRVELSWDPERNRYVGVLEGEVEIVPGSLEVEVETDGEKETATAEDVPVAPEPAHGGKIVLAGGLAAEVRASADGMVYAHLPDPELKEQVDGALTAKVQGDDGELHSAKLKWHENHERFVGKIEGGAKIVPGPIELVVQSGDEEHRGRIEQMAVARTPKHGGHVVIAGNHQIELVPTGKRKFHAFVFDAEGRRVTGNLDARIDIGAHPEPFKLKWNAKKKRYEAKIEGKGRGRIDLDTTPVRVSLKAGGRRVRGGLARGLAFARSHAALDVEARSGGNARVEGGAELQKKAKAAAKAGIAARAKARGRARQAAERARRLRDKARGAAAAAKGAAKAGIRAGGGAEGSASASGSGGNDDAQDKKKKKKGVSVGGSIEAGGSIGIGN